MAILRHCHNVLNNKYKCMALVLLLIIIILFCFFFFFFDSLFMNDNKVLAD